MHSVSGSRQQATTDHNPFVGFHYTPIALSKNTM